MLLDEPDVFAQEGGNIGCIPNLKLKLNLKDHMSVQKCFNSIPETSIHRSERICPKPTGERLDQKFHIPKFTPGGLRVQELLQPARRTAGLQSEIREMNHKTIPDSHPLPRIQDLLDNLGGYTWFSILDQGSAYHQDFVDESSRQAIAFSNLWGYMSGSASPLV